MIVKKSWGKTCLLDLLCRLLLREQYFLNVNYSIDKSQLIARGLILSLLDSNPRLKRETEPSIEIEKFPETKEEIVSFPNPTYRNSRSLQVDRSVSEIGSLGLRLKSG